MVKVVRLLGQEIAFEKQELKSLNRFFNGSIEGLAIRYAMQADAGKKDPNSMLRRLRGEVLFVLEHVVLHDFESIFLLLQSLLLSDGSRLNIEDRPSIRQLECKLKYQQGEQVVQKKAVFDASCDGVSVNVEQNNFGQVDVVFENEDCGLYRLRIAPFAKIPVHMHKMMSEAELVASDNLSLQGKPVKSGTSIKWPQGFPHCYINLGGNEQLVLCIDKPAFNPSDEIELPEDTHLPELKNDMIKNYW